MMTRTSDSSQETESRGQYECRFLSEMRKSGIWMTLTRMLIDQNKEDRLRVGAKVRIYTKVNMS